MPFSRSFFSALLALTLTVPSARAAAQTADEKALESYRLTMSNIQKVGAVMKSFADEAARDPKVQEIAALTKQMEPLHAKDELTDAEQAQLDKLQERLNALERSDDDDDDDDDSPASNAQSLASVEASITKHPAAVRALAQAGLSPRDYALTVVALLQASMIEGFSQGKMDLKALPRGVNPDNILFVRAHKAELDAMHKAMASKP